MSHLDATTHRITHRYASPWSPGQRVAMLLWECCWKLFCTWTPKPLNSWRMLWLSAFGATLTGRPFVHQRARIQIPWNVTLGDRSCLGDRANLYSLGEIEIGPRAVIAQEAYLCTGTHDFDHPDIPLQTSKIVIEADAFVGARAFVLPGVRIGEGSIIGACSVVTRNVPPWSIWAGSPARFVRDRPTPVLPPD